MSFSNWLYRLLGLVLILVGLIGVFFVLHGVQSKFKAHYWSQRTCTIESAKINKTQVRTDGEIKWNIKVRYRYSFGAKTYIGNVYDVNWNFSLKKPQAEKVVRKLFSQQRVTCCVNPENPTESAI